MVTSLKSWFSMTTINILPFFSTFNIVCITFSLIGKTRSSLRLDYNVFKEFKIFSSKNLISTVKKKIEPNNITLSLVGV